ncbi:MAG: cytochrome c [Novosphingobium sp.]
MRRLCWAAALSLIAVAGAAIAAAPADTVRSRIAGYRALGAAFKSANDTVRSGDVRSPRLQQAAAQISAAARRQYQWFPAGSGPQAQVKTAARPEIWTRAAQFRSAQDGFARQAVAFERTVRGGNAAAIRTEARKLGGQCKACHDQFRVPHD